MHEYLRVGNFYVHSGLSVLQLGRHLWQQADQFLGSEGKTPSARRDGFLGDSAVKVVRIVRQMAGYLMAKGGIAGGSRRDRLSLPVAGDLAIVRRSGAVKVLDLRNREVFTVVVDDGERAKLQERIDLGRSVAHLPFAPQVRQVDLQGGYFSEEFLSGSHPLDFAGCKDDFAQVYLPLLRGFITSFEPRWEDLRSYADGLRDDILAPDGLLQRMTPEERRKVSTFVERTHAEVAAGSGSIPLVLSHGDYFSGNIVIDDTGYRAIDWANMGFRSPLHDLYYLYLNHCCRVLDWHSVKRRAEAASAQLRTAVAETDSALLAELERFLTPSDALRRLFYLECVQVPLVRCSDPRDRYLASMLVRIGWFEEFERAMQEGPVEGRVGTSSAMPAPLRLDGNS